MLQGSRTYGAFCILYCRSHRFIYCNKDNASHLLMQAWALAYMRMRKAPHGIRVKPQVVSYLHARV